MPGLELLTNRELTTIQDKEAYLRDIFLKIAEVKDYEKGYVSVPFVNQLIDTKLQRIASEIVAHHVQAKSLELDRIVQISYSGNPFATSVAEKLGTLLAPGRKGKTIPGAWKQPVVIEREAMSFTTGEASSFVFNGLKEGDRALLVDDVVAHGNTACLITEELRKLGIEVKGVVFYFAKLFQPGVERIRKELGIEPFYTIGIESITPEGGIKLSPPLFQLDPPGSTPTP